MSQQASLITLHLAVTKTRPCTTEIDGLNKFSKYGLPFSTLINLMRMVSRNTVEGLNGQITGGGDHFDLQTQTEFRVFFLDNRRILKTVHCICILSCRFLSVKRAERI